MPIQSTSESEQLVLRANRLCWDHPILSVCCASTHLLLPEVSSPFPNLYIFEANRGNRPNLLYHCNLNWILRMLILLRNAFGIGSIDCV